MPAEQSTNAANTKFVEKIISDKQLFDSFVYTPWRDAIEELNRRADDTAIDEYLTQILPHGVPKPLEGLKSMVYFRNIATPNYECGRFLMTADVLHELHPLIFEYTKDKYADINESKFALGKLRFYKGLNKIHEPVVEYKTILDMSRCNGKSISTLTTIWGQGLIEFHHEFMEHAYPESKASLFDLSDWLTAISPNAHGYYKNFLSLFLKHGILFENFLLTKQEMPFTEHIIIPALIEIEKETGKKPLIVALEPTTIEGDRFWISYPYKQKKFVDSKMH